ncbi:MAG: tetratricopeptide repeat protein [Acidobacteria bacterium]|nr:tetratricopeptide repeat protein [Acidobacteriota bacterium]
MAAKRLTRKEIVQEDIIQAFLTGMLRWAAANSSVLATFFGIFLLSIGGAYVWQNYQGSRSEELQVQFAEALEIYHAPVSEETTGVSEDQTVPSAYQFQFDQERRVEALGHFRTIAEDHPNTDLGLLARYYMALIKQEMGQTEQAEGDLTFVMENSSQPHIKYMARHLLVRLAESNDDRQRATALLEEILLEASGFFPKDTILLQLGQNHEAAGNAQEAVVFYQRLTTEYPTSVYFQEAQIHLQQLAAENN